MLNTESGSSPPSAETSAPSAPPLDVRLASKSFDGGQIKLYPPVRDTKPLACASDALKVADSAPLEPSAVEQIWLGQLDASIPAFTVDGKSEPSFPNVLAWVVVTHASDDKECCVGETPGPKATETAYIDANTGQRLFATGYDAVLGPAS